MTPHALLFTLAAIGIAETSYLIKIRRLGQKAICPIQASDCHIVLESKYSKTLAVHNDLLGMLFYLVVAVVAAALVIGTPYANLLDTFVKLLILFGTFFSAYLTYLQWKVIKAWCTWCLMSALTVYLMLVIVLTTKLLP